MAIWYNILSGYDCCLTLKKLPAIDGKPTLHTLIQTLKHLWKCSQKIKSGLGSLGYLFFTLPPQHYQQFTGVPLVLPGPMPQLPTYPPGTTSSARENIKLEWQAHKAENDNIHNMTEALLTLFLDTIQPAYKRHFENDLVGVTQQSFWDAFNSFLDKYGRVTPIYCEQNIVQMKTCWDPSAPSWKFSGQKKIRPRQQICAVKPNTGFHQF